MRLAFDPHPLLDAGAFTSALERPLSETATPAALLALLRLDAPAPLASSDDVRKAVRDLLRHGGYKPTGRGKPASEYLLGIAQQSTLESINALVDACNAVSLHSWLSISVVDLDRTVGALRVGLAPEGASYVFNASGQTIDLGGLLCLFDEEGPCANAVKDAQRTKTSADTRRTLSIVWGTRALPGRTGLTVAWYRELIAALQADTSSVERI
jgi:DNA/RNA-binding domain of Phe-tRNA-synthetase-like protein